MYFIRYFLRNILLKYMYEANCSELSIGYDCFFISYSVGLVHYWRIGLEAKNHTPMGASSRDSLKKSCLSGQVSETAI